jgi:hypothetical protein
MTDRGQSTLDFLLGTVVFLLAVVFVVTVVPTMLDPFVTGTEPHPLVADRAVDTLVEDELGAAGTGIVAQDRVDTVFARSESALRTDLAVPETISLNATLRNGSGVVRSVGPAPPDRGSVTAARRVVTVSGSQSNVTVQVW